MPDEANLITEKVADYPHQAGKQLEKKCPGRSVSDVIRRTLHTARSWRLDRANLEAAATVPTRFVSLILGLSLNLVLARKLAPAGFGQYYFTMTFIAFALVFTGGGLARLAQRFVAQCLATEQGSSEIMYTIAGFQTYAIRRAITCSVMMAALFGLLAAFQGKWQIGPLNQSILLITALAIPILSVNDLLAGVALGRGKIFLGMFSRSIVQPLVMICMLLLFVDDQSPVSSVLSFFAGAALLMLLVTSYFSQDLRPIGYSKVESKQWSVAAWQFSLSSLFTIGLLQGDVLLLGLLSTDVETGNYALAARIAALAVVPLALVTSAYSHVLAGAFASGDRTTLMATLEKMGWLALVLGSPVVASCLLAVTNCVTLQLRVYASGDSPDDSIRSATIPHQL